MAAIIQAAKQVGGAPLLEAINRYNDEVCRRAEEGRRKTSSDSPTHHTDPASATETSAVPT
jgi:hypothetical protein